jgi:hypothetical protein
VAISITGGGAASAGTTSVGPTVPATVDAGDLLILVVGNKYPNNGPSTPSGWTALGNNQASGGSGSSGVDSGNVYATIFVREADGTEDGTTVTVSIPSGNSAIARIFRATKTSGASWATVLRIGADNTVDGTFSVTFGPSSVDLKVDDIVLVVAAINGNAHTFSSQALTGSGLTTNAGTERSDAGTTQGDDMSYVVWSCTITGAGAGSTTATFSMTADSPAAANSPAGAAVMIRIREEMIGSGSGALPGLGATGTGEQQFVASGTGALQGLGASGSGEERFEGSGTGVLGALGAAGAGEEQFIGSGTGLLNGLGAAGVGEEVFEGSGTGILDGIDATGTGEEQFIATGTGALPGLGASGVGDVTNPPGSPSTAEFSAFLRTTHELTGGRTAVGEFAAGLRTVHEFEGGQS